MTTSNNLRRSGDDPFIPAETLNDAIGSTTIDGGKRIYYFRKVGNQTPELLTGPRLAFYLNQARMAENEKLLYYAHDVCEATGAISFSQLKEYNYKSGRSRGELRSRNVFGNGDSTTTVEKEGSTQSRKRRRVADVVIDAGDYESSQPTLSNIKIRGEKDEATVLLFATGRDMKFWVKSIERLSCAGKIRDHGVDGLRKYVECVFKVMHESKPLAKCDGFYSDLPSLPSDVEELKLLHQKFESMCRIDANKGKNMAENSEPVNSEVSTKSKPKSTTLPPLRKSTTVSKALSASFTTSNTVNVGPNFCEEVNAAYSLALVFETRGLLKYNPVEIEKCPSTTEDIVDSLRSLPLGTDSESRLPSTLSNVTPLLSQNGNGNTSTTVLQQITIIQIPPPQTAAGTKEASTKASQLLHPEQEDTDKKFELDDVIHVYKTLHRPQTIPMFDVRKGESLKQLCSLWNSTEPPAREYLWHFVNVFGEEIFVPLSKEKRLLHGTDFWNQTKSKNWSNWEKAVAAVEKCGGWTKFTEMAKTDKPLIQTALNHAKTLTGWETHTSLCGLVNTRLSLLFIKSKREGNGSNESVASTSSNGFLENANETIVDWFKEEASLDLGSEEVQQYLRSTKPFFSRNGAGTNKRLTVKKESKISAAWRIEFGFPSSIDVGLTREKQIRNIQKLYSEDYGGSGDVIEYDTVAGYVVFSDGSHFKELDTTETKKGYRRTLDEDIGEKEYVMIVPSLRAHGLPSYAFADFVRSRGTNEGLVIPYSVYLEEYEKWSRSTAARLLRPG